MRVSALQVASAKWQRIAWGALVTLSLLLLTLDRFLFPAVFLLAVCWGRFIYGRTRAFFLSRRQPTATQLCTEEALRVGCPMVGQYVIGFEADTGQPLLVSDDHLCTHMSVYARTGAGKTQWMLALLLQQMARGRASGATFIDAKRDEQTLAQVVHLAQFTGRLEDLIVIDPYDPVCSYNPLLTRQRAEVKARKVLRAALPVIADLSNAKHYERLASHAVGALTQVFEALGLAWSLRDMAVALSSFELVYEHLCHLLEARGEAGVPALTALCHLAATYRTPRGGFDGAKLTDNLRGIAAELSAIASGPVGASLCRPSTDLVLTDAIKRGKILYLMTPRLEDAETAQRLMRLYREDLEISIGEITSCGYRLDDPHLVLIDEAASTFSPSWANLFELSRKGRFALIFGAQSAGALMEWGPEFYERVMANTRTKLYMELGDSKTAEEAARWLGKTTVYRESGSAATATGKMHDWGGGSLRNSLNQSTSLSWSEDEDDLVKADYLKHQLSQEKGLAYFDLGGGRIVLGRTAWVAPIPLDGFAPRDHLRHTAEASAHEPLGLADWADDAVRQAEAELRQGNEELPECDPLETSPDLSAPPPQPPPPATGPLKFTAVHGQRRGKGRISTVARVDPSG